MVPHEDLRSVDLDFRMHDALAILRRHAHRLRRSQAILVELKCRGGVPDDKMRNDALCLIGHIQLPDLKPLSLSTLSLISRSRHIRIWAASAGVLARAIARSKAMRASSARPIRMRNAPLTPKKWK